MTLKQKLSSIFIVVVATASFLYCKSLMANNEDYEVYAKKQQEKAKVLIAPYKAEIAELIKSVKTRQLHSGIKSGAASKCPYLEKNTNAAASDASDAGQLPIAIFVSFSMPKESIKGWINQAKKVGASVYIRGLVNNSFKDTAKAVNELIQDNKGGLLIDPTLFKKHAIIQVPAVVLLDEDNFDVVYGNVTLDYALEKINKSRGGERKDLLEAIKKLRGRRIRNV